MTRVPEKVLNWLYSVLTSEYQETGRTYSDTARTLAHYPTLAPRTEVYTYENGAPALLLRLGGTLPVWSRGITYKYPLFVWVPHAYPREPPMIFVSSTDDLMIRPGQHVSPEGRVYHPYLAQWAQHWDKSSLVDMLAILQDVFAKEPPSMPRQHGQPGANFETSRQPTYASNAAMAGPSGAHSQQQPPMPPPKPHTPGQSSINRTPSGFQQPGGHRDPPPLPPLPGKSTEPSPNDRYSRPAPLPSQDLPQNRFSSPVTTSPGPNTALQQNRAQTYSQTPPSLPLHSGPSGFQAGYQQPRNNSWQGRPQQFSPPQQNQGQLQQNFSPPQTLPQQADRGQPPRGQPAQHRPPQYAPQPVYSQPAQQPAQVRPKEPAVDLLSSDLEIALPSQTASQNLPAPPVPPNPHKDGLLAALSQTFGEQLRQIVQQNHQAIPNLLSQQAAMRNAYSELQGELRYLKDLDTTLASNEQILKQSMQEADDVMANAKRREVPSIDEVLVAPSVVGTQLWNLCAEEAGVGEALWCLGRAVDQGRIGGEVFVKQTRALAREQFLKKALIKKIAKGIALDMPPTSVI